MTPDITKTDILNRRLIVSKRRNKQLKDVASLWKKSLLELIEEDPVDLPLVNPPSLQIDIAVQPRQPSPGLLSLSLDSEESVQLHRRSSSPGVGKGWFGS